MIYLFPSQFSEPHRPLRAISAAGSHLLQTFFTRVQEKGQSPRQFLFIWGHLNYLQRIANLVQTAAKPKPKTHRFSWSMFFFRRPHFLQSSTFVGSDMSTTDERKLAVEFNLLKESTESPFTDHFPNYADGLYKGEPGGFVLQPGYAKNADQLYNYRPRSDDIWVASFPKCGKNLQ